MAASTNSWLLPSGVVAYSVTGAAFALFVVAFNQIREYNVDSKEPFSRVNARWRFYSVFGFVMIILGGQGLTYGLFAEIGITNALSAEHNHLALRLFGVFFVAFPVIWLEFIYSRIRQDLGFTQYYETNFREVDGIPRRLIEFYFEKGPQNSEKRQAPKTIGEKIRAGLVFLIIWPIIYAGSPLLCFHIFKNRRRLANLPLISNLQLCQDTLLLISVLVAVFCLFGYMNADLLIVFHLSALVFVAICGLFATQIGNDIQNTAKADDTKPLLFLTIYFVFQFVDFFGMDFLKKWVPSLGFDAPVFQTNVVVWLKLCLQLLGGVTTIWLFVMIIRLIGSLLRDIATARKGALETLQRTIATHLSDMALHHIGNKFQPVTSALENIRNEFSNEHRLKELLENRHRQELLRESINDSLEAMIAINETVRNLKLERFANRLERLQWHPIKDLLRDIKSQKIQVSKDRFCAITATIQNISLHVDKDLFRDVIQNLVNNAAAAIRNRNPEQPELQIGVSYHPGQPLPLQITIIDNGTGIAERDQAQIFQPYFTTKGNGTGIGLYVVKTYMDSVAGTVSFTTQTNPKKDSGTTFVLKFPGQLVKEG